MNKDISEKILYLLKEKKNEALAMLKLTEDIKALCEKDEPETDQINKLLKKRQLVIDKINDLDSQLKNYQENTDLRVKNEIIEIFKKIKEIDDRNHKVLSEKFDKYKTSLKNINESIKINNAYKTRETSVNGYFIDTRE